MTTKKLWTQRQIADEMDVYNDTLGSFLSKYRYKFPPTEICGSAYYYTQDMVEKIITEYRLNQYTSLMPSNLDQAMNFYGRAIKKATTDGKRETRKLFGKGRILQG